MNKSDYLQSLPIVFENNSELVLNDNTVISKLKKNEIIINSEIISELGLNISDCVGKKITILVQKQFTLEIVEKLELTIKGISK